MKKEGTNKKIIAIICSVLAVIAIAVTAFLLINNKKEFEVKFNSKGGTSVATQLVKESEKAERPEDPTRAGYEFDDWYLNDEVYDFSTPVTKNITLIAKWELEEAEIEVDVEVDEPAAPEENTGGSTTGSTSKPSTSKPSTSTPSTSTPTTPTTPTTPSTPTTPEKPKPTYSVVWVDVEGSSIGQATMHIKSSEGGYVAGTVTITTAAGKTSDVEVTAAGKMYVKSAIESAVVKSVK